ncbi:hypothetical protein D9619_005004 [Psilocybe cf. subviscida]|uniref:Protein-S-isoprenylcysteine O-methyltransferase n=1 Tax=Psilocybe cf. subviscida TaxID=2480587 RepID=A0A8H5BPA3_9AGAR|nr:hypothetical protein D9619_005004 [Psilocybe cf. subviscida]
MSLFKIHLTLLIGWGFNRCTAPPFKAAPKDAKRILTLGESEWLEQEVLPWAARAHYLFSISEALVILACHFPGSQALQSFAAQLTAHGSSATCTALTLSPQQAIGAGLLLTGTFIRLWAFAHMGDLFAFTAAVRKDHRLVTAGPYSIVRHPGYTGALISHPGWLLWTFGSSGRPHASGIWDSGIMAKIFIVVYSLFTLGPWLIISRRAKVEDEALREHFDPKCDQWAEKVRYRVVPGLF